ncbi:hypothetical protein D9757_004318 [Collybiopsis confluens]|uniref:Uncharacterized protein n=1 Tax=Collybiopsis confluens TaxID=2823264 RepID=A0A8H5HTV9_9AGAR|nr:hypothetical protein D9757_004318 [Collybiopsis confluens]
MVHSEIPQICINLSDSPLVEFAENDASSDATNSSSGRQTANCSSSSLSSSCASLAPSLDLRADIRWMARGGCTRISPAEVVTLLNLLDTFDADVDVQVAQVKENISQALELVKLAKAERAEQRARARRGRD